MFSHILKTIMNNKEAYHLLSNSTYELTQAFGIPVSEFYKIRREFSELTMIKIDNYSREKRFKGLKSTCTINNYTY